MNEYRPDLLRTIFHADGRCANRPYLMLVCYLDDSDDVGSPVVTLGDYLGSQSAWESYESASGEIYDSYGVDCLHTKKLHWSKGCFKNWSTLKKHSFVEEIFTDASSLVECGISTAISKSSIKKLKVVGGKAASMSPYGVALDIMLLRLMASWVGPKIRADGLSFIVENGPTNGAIADAFDRLSDSSRYKDILGTIAFAKKKSCRAIQLADFNAFYSRRLQSIVYRLSDLHVAIPTIYNLAMQDIPHGFEMLRGAPQFDHERKLAAFSTPKGAWIGPLRGRG